VVEEQKLTGRSAGPAGPDAAVPDGGGDQQRQVLIDVLLSYTFVCLGVDLQRSVRFLFVSSPGFQVGLYSFISNDFCQIDYRNIHRTDLQRICNVGRTMGVDERWSEVALSLAEWTLPRQPI